VSACAGLSSPAAERNKGPILDVLRSVLPESGRVLEIASGSGQHAVHFAAQLPGVIWQSSDPDPTCRAAAMERFAAADLPNLPAIVDLDVHAWPWPIASADAVVCINMIHIAPWSATEALFEGAGRVLHCGGPLILYGPFRRAGVATAASNEAFDANLRRRDPRWGLRQLESVVELAARHGVQLERVSELPANNIAVVFRCV
jgi:SAM-dependent methyltransferase